MERIIRDIAAETKRKPVAIRGWKEDEPAEGSRLPHLLLIILLIQLATFVRI